MKIRVYPANRNDNNKLYQELEFDALPRIGDFVGVPFEVEKEWAREALKRRSLCEWYSQWLYYRASGKCLLDFSDASIVSQITWLYDYNLKMMIPWIALDCESNGEYMASKREIIDIAEDEWENIYRSTSEFYELEENL